MLSMCRLMLVFVDFSEILGEHGECNVKYENMELFSKDLVCYAEGFCGFSG